LKDVERYQTVYANLGGSSAAPTAGLHFTDEVLSLLKEKGADFADVSLDVGLDTFRPMAAETTEGHLMHGETCRVSQETADKIRDCKGRVIAVGTTTARTLEAFSTEPRRLEIGEKTTKIFITPGYQFKTVDAMFTNFHMPRTTMMLMISALAGRDLVMESYKMAVECRFRMLSFGDSMLILPDSLPG
jgi:S-adenosylmethionine:tRNA ribosyltransferase-isomerase